MPHAPSVGSVLPFSKNMSNIQALHLEQFSETRGTADLLRAYLYLSRTPFV